MRSSRALLLAAGALALGACVSADVKKACYPVASWTSPVFRCDAPPAPPPVVEEEPPPPPPPPPPEDELPITEDKIVIVDHVQFETNSAVLLDESKPVLDMVVKVMKDHPELTKVQVEGHTDAQDTKKHNQKLSEQRAEAVRQYLIAQGIEPERLTAKGFGEDVPIATNETEAGRFINRRVEFTILERSDR